MEDKLKEMKKRSKNTSDLSDIVLEKDSKSAANGKKWLLTAAAAILLFLIVLVVMKMLNKPGLGSQENLASAGDSTGAGTITQHEVQAATTDSIDENGFKKEPIINEKAADSSDTDLKFEEMVRKLKEQDKISDTSDNAGVKQEDLSNVVKEVKQQEIKPAVEVVNTPAAPNKLQEVAKTAKENLPKAKKEAKTKKEVIQKSTPATVTANTIKGYFVQVGATAKSFPRKSFLQKVKKAGFDYIVHTVYINNKTIKKVLVGPYKTREAVQSVLPAIKSNLNPNAYIYRLK